MIEEENKTDREWQIEESKEPTQEEHLGEMLEQSKVLFDMLFELKEGESLSQMWIKKFWKPELIHQEIAR